MLRWHFSWSRRVDEFVYGRQLYSLHRERHADSKHRCGSSINPRKSYYSEMQDYAIATSHRVFHSALSIQCLPPNWVHHVCDILLLQLILWCDHLADRTRCRRIGFDMVLLPSSAVLHSSEIAGCTWTLHHNDTDNDSRNRIWNHLSQHSTQLILSTIPHSNFAIRWTISRSSTNKQDQQNL